MNKTLDDLYVDLTKEISADQPLLTIGGVTVMSKGSMSLISGKPKSRKTFFVSSIVAAMIGDNGRIGLTSEGKHKVLWIDTEQSISFFQEGIKRALRMAGIPGDRNDNMLIPMSFASISTEDRTIKTEEAIIRYKPELVIIDGIRDLLYDFNDIRETARLKDLIIGLYQTYNLHVCCVIHQNKADCNARGHLGSELTNKSETVFSIESIAEKTIVSPERCRNKPFEEFAFRVNKESDTELATMRDTRPRIKLHDDILKVFQGKEELRYCEIASLLREINGSTKRASERLVSRASEENMIQKTGNGKYVLSSTKWQ